MIRLVALLDRYGEAIAADLALLGWDVVDLYESRRWAFALTIIDHLPRTSNYSHAVAQDDELAEELPERTDSRSVPMTDWSPEVEALAAVVDRLAEVANSVIASAGGKPSRVRPYPRPKTAFDRVRERRRDDAIHDLARKLFPHLDKEA